MRNGEATGEGEEAIRALQLTFWGPPLFAGPLQEQETFFLPFYAAFRVRTRSAKLPFVTRREAREFDRFRRRFELTLHIKSSR